ncbi:MAG: patatin-like phospholipase family protein [Chitinophagales bacterium]
MKQRLLAVFCIFAYFLFTVEFIAAQQKSTRPKIGLTLSGGGAKGLAHIGILQAIDSAGLKIDYITGTSMGSIVGSLYAAGYSGDDIEKIARNLDWTLMFSTAPQLNVISIEEKSEYEKYAIEIPFVKGKFKIGRGIIEGQELWLTLSELFEPVYNVTDFSKLSIPFKCIGTDLETGNAVVMDHGNIVTAVRASMAIPSIFTPVRYDDKLLVDGGVVNNFPVLDVKEMGADYVIGVNLNNGLDKADSLETALDILLQIGFFKDASTFDKHRMQCDLYILPDLKGYGTGDFSQGDSIIDIGKETGKLYYPYFKKLADSLTTIYGASDFIKNRLPQNNSINISKYSIDGLNHTSDKFFFGLLDLQDNKNYSYRQMSGAIRKVYGSRYYRIVRYDFLPDGKGSTEMHFHVEENPLTAIKFGLNYNNFTKLALKLNLTSRDLLFKESRATVSVAVSENPRLFAEYFRFINKNRTARAVFDLYSEAVDYPVYIDFRLNQTLRSYYSAYGLQFQRNVNRYSYIGAGQQYIRSKIKTEESPSLIYNGHNNYWYSYLSYVINNTDEKYFPVKGWNVKAEAGYVYSQNPEFEYSYNDSSVNSDSAAFNYDNYFKIYINASHYSELNSKFSWSHNFTLAYLIQNNPYLANNLVVGGVKEIIRNQVPFVGLNESELKTGSIAVAQLGLQYKLSKKAYLIGRFNIALYDFQGTGFNNLSAKSNLLTGYGLTCAIKSPIGPLEFTVMHCDQDSKVRTNINIGFGF